MGIRIHKAIGYGLPGNSTDHDDGSIYNTYNNRESLIKKINSFKELTFDDHYRKDGSIIDMNWDHDFVNFDQSLIKGGDVVMFCADCDNTTGTWLIIPPAFSKSWYRFDDAIDYAESSHEAVGYVKPLRSIYPYHEMFDYADTNKITYSVSIRQQSPTIRSVIPFSVRCIANDIGMNWLDLRPVICCWWA